MSSADSNLGDFIRRGYAQASPEHIEEVRLQVALEQEWLKNEQRYAGTYEVLLAAECGELVPISPTPNYRPNARFLEPRNYAHGLLPFLQPGAATILNTLGNMWREHADAMGVDPRSTLALTSFVRSIEYQILLSQDPGKLALDADESSHPTGWAFDIDSSSYYLIEDGQAPKSVSWRDAAKQEKLGLALRHYLGSSATRTEIAGPAEYDPNALKALHAAASVLHNAGLVNRIIEFPGTDHECLHICVNPEPFQSGR